MKEKKRIHRKQIIVFFVVVLLITGMSAFGQSGTIVPDKVQTSLEQIQDVFTGDVAKIIVSICFGGSCIAYAYNKDNEKMKAKLIAVMIASGLLALSQEIVSKAFDAAL